MQVTYLCRSITKQQKTLYRLSTNSSSRLRACCSRKPHKQCNSGNVSCRRAPFRSKINIIVLIHQLLCFRNTAATLRSIFDSTVDSFASSPLVPGFVESEVIPLLRQGLEIVYQIPDVLRSINNGTRDFVPAPSETKVIRI